MNTALLVVLMSLASLSFAAIAGGAIGLAVMHLMKRDEHPPRESRPQIGRESQAT